MSLEMKSCPFCGGVPWIRTEDVEPQEDRFYSGRVEIFVYCSCGATLFDEGFHEGFSSEEDAIRCWNRRREENIVNLREQSEESKKNV